MRVCVCLCVCSVCVCLSVRACVCVCAREGELVLVLMRACLFEHERACSVCRVGFCRTARVRRPNVKQIKLHVFLQGARDSPDMETSGNISLHLLIWLMVTEPEVSGHLRPCTAH